MPGPAVGAYPALVVAGRAEGEGDGAPVGGRLVGGDEVAGWLPVGVGETGGPGGRPGW
jgi:hypothetical protein